MVRSSLRNPFWLIAAACWTACSTAHELDTQSPVYLEIDGAMPAEQADASTPPDAGEDAEPAASGSGSPTGGGGNPMGGGSPMGGRGNPMGGRNSPMGGGCSPASCMDATTMFGDYQGCCVDGACGYQIGDDCVPTNTPGTPNDACEDVDFGLFQLTGCCRPDDTCGVTVVMTLPLGCTTHDVSDVLFADFAAGASGGTPARCD